MDDVFSTAVKNQWRSLIGMVMAEYAIRISKRSLGLLEELLSLSVITGSMLILRLVTRAPTHHGMPVIPFVISGMILFWMLRTTLFRVASFKTAKGAFRANPRVTSLDVLAARAILNIVFYMMIGFPVFITFYWLGLSPFMANPVQVFLLMLLMGIWGFALGLCFGALFIYVPFAKMVVAGLMMIAMWASGVMFIWPEAPYMLRGILIYNPIFHFMELMRTAYFKTYITQMGSWVYVLSTVGVTIALGLMLERVTRKRAQASTQRQGADEDAFDVAAGV
ncbi:ABC transporter permease [Xanthobacter variabilis]|uniref:ABC transporter permease n=1 Tax=Xanthobacter variabilis TaxID=3119932 RepID=UPI003726DF02